jgi:hypothetical protein
VTDQVHNNGYFTVLTDAFEEQQPGFFSAAGTRPGHYPGSRHAVQESLYASSFWYQHRQACILQLLEHHPVDWLLDLGGSHGHLTEAIAHTCPAALMEPDEQGARAAYDRGLRPVFHGTLATAGVPAGSINAVGLFDVLEHIPDDRQFLKDVHEVLQNDGKLFLTVPALACLWSEFDRSVGHQRRYSLGALKKLLQDCGFELLCASYMFIILPLPMLIARRLQPGSQPGREPAPRNHHLPTGSVAGRLLGAVLKLEKTWLRWGLTLPIGSSCVCVARKVPA